MIGRTIGRYRILSLEGEGGMGKVWKAEDTLLGRPVALKFLPEGCTEEDRARFLRGLRAAAALNHPGIAAVYEAGEGADGPFAALAWVDGETLADLLARGPVPVSEAIRIASAAADTLAHAHAHGVLHRDVTARNIMVARDGRVVVVDFGLAWREGSTRISSRGTRVGTSGYMAPEVLRNGAADARSDLYSLGVVLYELLTGTLPVTGRAEARDYQTLHESVDPPGRLRAGIPAELERVVLRLLEKEPEKRYASAADVAADVAVTLREGTTDRPAVEEASPASHRFRIPDRKYVAVLPFLSLSSSSSRDEPGELLAAGFAEAVSGELGRLPRVRVFSPSTLGVQGSSPDILAIAARTGANLVVTGSVRRVGDEFRLQWSLIQPATGMQLAAEVLAGSLANAFELEDRLVAGIAAALGFGDEVRTVRVRARGRDPAAHERYLQALGYLRRHENEASVDGAVALLERLIAGDAKVAAYHAALARACLRKHQLVGGSRWLSQAAGACDRAMRLEPKSPEVLLTLGEIHTATGRPAEAVAAYEEALALREGDADTLVALSRALEAAGRLPEGESAARRAIRTWPDDWRGYNRLGVLQFHEGRFADALEAWREVARITPDNARGWYNTGSALYHLDRFEEAIDAYRHAIRIRPTARAFAWLGTVLFYSGRLEEATSAFEKARDLDPADAMGWGNLGAGFRWTPGREAEAREPLERAVHLLRDRLAENPRDAQGWSHLANWLGTSGVSTRPARRSSARSNWRHSTH